MRSIEAGGETAKTHFVRRAPPHREAGQHNTLGDRALAAHSAGFEPGSPPRSNGVPPEALEVMRRLADGGFYPKINPEAAGPAARKVLGEMHQALHQLEGWSRVDVFGRPSGTRDDSALPKHLEERLKGTHVAAVLEAEARRRVHSPQAREALADAAKVWAGRGHSAGWKAAVAFTPPAPEPLPAQLTVEDVEAGRQRELQRARQLTSQGWATQADAQRLLSAVPLNAKRGPVSARLETELHARERELYGLLEPGWASADPRLSAHIERLTAELKQLMAEFRATA